MEIGPTITKPVVLVCDESPEIRALLERMLSSMYTVICIDAQGGAAAFKRAAIRVDAIVTDTPEAFLPCGTPIVCVCSSADGCVPGRCKATLPKPFDYQGSRIGIVVTRDPRQKAGRCRLSLGHERLTNAFSKKIGNHIHSVALFHMHYNFVVIHQTLRVSPAMAAGITTRLWSVWDIVNLAESQQRIAA